MGHEPGRADGRGVALDSLDWLQAWYRSTCDGDREHSYGLTLETLDNPGWLLMVDLADTELENRPFTPVETHRSEEDWIDCRLRDGKFQGACGAGNLKELIELFRAWVDAPPAHSPGGSNIMEA